MKTPPRLLKILTAAITTEREIAWRAGRAGGPYPREINPVAVRWKVPIPNDFICNANGNAPGNMTTDDTATGAADNDAEYWAEQARHGLPAPIGEWAARAIEQCIRTTKGKRLLPTKPACERLENIGQSPEWAALPPTRQSLVISLLVEGAALFPGVITAALGRPGKPPPPLAQSDANDAPDTLADLGTIEPAHPVAAGLLFAGRLGLMHGPAGGGKTTVLANVIARVTTGRPWLGRPVKAGPVLLVAEDTATWAHTITAAGGNPRRVRLRRWPDLPAAVEQLRPVAVVVDTLQFVAHETGSAELDSAQAVDAILRPLERLCRKYDCAAVVTDHEPWADSTAPGRDKDSGTQKRPRHSGAKVATADYILRVTTADGVTTITRGAKVRWGIAVEPAVSVDIRGEPVAGPAPAAETGGAVSGMDGSTVLTDTELYDRLLGFLMQHDGATKTQIRDGLKMRGRKSKALDRVLDQAVAAGRIERQAGPSNSVRHCVVPHPETLPPRNDGTDLSRSVRSANGNGAGTNSEPVPGTGSAPYRERRAERTSGTGSAARTGTDFGAQNEVPRPPERPAENPATPPPSQPEEEQIMTDLTTPRPPGETFAVASGDDPPPDAAARVADAFARGAAVRRQTDDGELPPSRIRAMLLSDDPPIRRDGRRLALLDHQDGGAAGRRLSLPERVRFMAS